MSALPKIGIDIGSSSIKIVELAPVGDKKWKLLTAASLATPEGAQLVSGQANLPAISATIAKICKEAGVHTRQVVASVPEEQVSTHLVEMPAMTEAEIEQALEWQVEQYIPLAKEDAVWSYQVVKKDETAGSMEVLLVAVSKKIAESYRQVMEQAGLEVVALETELTASSRSLTSANVGVSLVVDIGARSTDIGVTRMGQLLFSRTVPTAGEAFTRAIETTLGLETAQAEQYKNTYGFAPGQLQGKLLEAMKPVLNLIATEIKKTMDFYRGKHPSESAKSVILSGGVAVLPDVITSLSAQVGMEVLVGNPFATVSMDDAQKKALTGNEPFYATAVGLSMYGS